jgi:DNA-binding transcriptional regulator of glucitol operon
MKLTKNKEKIADIVVVVAAWAIALALVYITILKFKRLLH